MNEEDLIDKIRQNPSLQPKKNIYENEKTSTLWSFNENQKYPDIYKSDDSSSVKSSKTSESLKTVVEDLNIDKSMIETPDLSSLNNFENYEKFYKKLILICQAFPFFISKIDKKEVEEKFNFLYTYYIQSRYSNKCFISSNILAFNNAFEALCENLKNSNLDLSRFDKVNKGKKNLAFGNIIFPNPVIVSPPFRSNWYERKPKEVKPENIEDTILKRHEETAKAKVTDLEIPEKKETEEKNRHSTSTSKKTSSTPSINYLPKKPDDVKLLEKKEDKEEDKEELYSDDEKEEKKEEKDDTIKIRDIDGDVTKDLSKKSLEKLKKEDVNKSLEKVFRVMEMEQKDDKLLLPSEDQFSEQLKLEDCNKMSYDGDRKDEENKGLPIKNLNKLSRNLSLNFYRHIIALNSPTNRICGIIAIDCFRAISIRDKIFNIILATSMANCFDYLEIPYSVVVFADFKFQYIIKKYNEPHSDKIIQRIFDAVLVKRFFTRIADVCWFIQRHPDLVHTERNYRIVNVISCGLDPKLKIPDQWHGIFDQDEKTKFGFYFLPPNNPKYIDNLHTIWENFRNELSVPLISIDDNRIIVLGEYTKEKSTYNDIVNTFVKIFSSIEYDQEELKMDKIVKKRTKIECDIMESLDISSDNKFMEILEAMKNREINIDKIFIQNKPHELSKEKVLEDIKISSNHIIQKVNSYNNVNEAIVNQILSNDYKEGKRALIDLIFPPNKPSMYAPSRKGTRLYIMGLVNFVLTKGQDNKIWLDKIAGLVKDYRITIIIDNSISCFNDLMNPHSFQTIISFIQIFSSVSIPFFDIIIAKKEKPIILMSGQDSFNSLTSKSPVWPALIEILGKPEYNVNLRDALTCLLKFRNLNAAKKHFAFIFTDGLFSNLGEKESIKNYIAQIEESGVSLFGIGLGYYPRGIKDIFGKCTWTLNPHLILNGISKLIDNEIKTDSNMTVFDLEMKNPEDLIENYEKNFRHNIIFRDLVYKLDEANLFPESMAQFINPEEVKSDTKVNPELNDKNGMAQKGAFKGLKILCACFWSKNIAGEDEDERVDPKYLLERHPKSKFCLKDALDFYGIELTVKCNYKDCIKLLQTGDYYACWVISGDGSDKLPDEGANSNLVGQFIECLVRFWKIGGSLVFWSDSKPLFYQTNLFLEYADFPDVGKLKIKFKGNDLGCEQMVPGNISEVKEKVFNEEKRFSDGKHYRPSLSHNIVNIAIGTTISYIDDETKIYPLVPFGYAGRKDQDTRIPDSTHCNILFYPSNREYPNGDIVFDGGFSKLFNELDSGENYSTFRYVQNIAAFTTQFAKRYAEFGDDWVETFKLPSFDFELDESVIWTRFEPRITNEFDIVYLIDATGSMGSTIQAAKDTVISIANDLKSKFSKINFQFGCIFYRDPIDSKSDKHTLYYLTNDISELSNDISGESPDGGGDGPEDFVGAYKNVFKMAWRNGTKLVIHIADAPAHCNKYCGYDNHEEESGKLEPLLRRCAEEGIKIICFDIDDGCRSCFEKMRDDYLPYGKDLLFNIENFDTSGSSKIIASNFKKLVIASAACAVPKGK